MRSTEPVVARMLRHVLRATSSGWHPGATSLMNFSTLGLESGAYTAKNLRDVTVLVTGSTDGIGFHTANLLAQHGATVLVHGRSLLKVKKTIKFLRTHSANRNVYGYCEDLSSLAATRRLAASVVGDLHKFFQGRLDCLINNAGVFMEDKEVTEDGLEMTWAVNTAAPFLLTAEILPFMSDHGRIVNCSSIPRRLYRPK
jgi:NAD(P)-dependent dehydrogenase (short-subunit alcohol dehydrogenase family)